MKMVKMNLFYERLPSNIIVVAQFSWPKLYWLGLGPKHNPQYIFVENGSKNLASVSLFGLMRG